MKDESSQTQTGAVTVQGEARIINKSQKFAKSIFIGVVGFLMEKISTAAGNNYLMII